VVVLEEHAEAGRPVHCTGLLGDEAFSEFGLPSDLVLARAGAARFWGAAGESVSMQSASVRASIIDRGALDAFLAGRAADAAAEIRTSARVDSISVTESGVHVAVRGGAPVVARACVLACGANYRFHGSLGLGRPTAFLQSAQVDIVFPERPSIEVRFGRQLAPGGFGWIVPFRREGESRARIGLMSESRTRERFAAFVDAVRTPAAAAAIEGVDPRMKMLPLAPIARTFADRVVAVGDAAGLVKPTTGGGIYYGMLSGAMAGETVVEALNAGDLSAAALSAYERRWQQRLGSEIRAGLRFRQVMAGLDDPSIDALIDLAKVNGVAPLLQRTASFNWHRRAALALLAHPAFRRIALKSWPTVTPSER